MTNIQFAIVSILSIPVIFILVNWLMAGSFRKIDWFRVIFFTLFTYALCATDFMYLLKC